MASGRFTGVPSFESKGHGPLFSMRYNKSIFLTTIFVHKDFFSILELLFSRRDF